MNRKRRGDVRFLLTCRDTDWIAAQARHLSWGSYTEYKEETISGLDAEDAQAIIHAWGRYGEQGLRELTGTDENQAARRLLEAATHEAATGEGAFFGAMLAVRIGEGLREHVKTLLSRLGDRKIPGGGTLQLALAYIAAMHAEGLTFLSRPVLAEVLGCQIRELRPHVLMPLGKEASATGAGQFILTRHRTIAHAVVDVLSDVFGHEMDDLYVDMALAAINARPREFIPDYHKWEYSLPQHFFQIGREDLANRIGQRLLEKDPTNPHFIVNLARLYRESGDAGKAVELFHGYSAEVPNDRAFHHEWAVAECNVGNYLIGAWLAGLSLSDQILTAPPDNTQSKLSLASLGVTFGELYDRYSERAFIEGQSAVGQLGLELQLDPKTRNYFDRYLRESQDEGVAKTDINTALILLHSAVKMAWELGKSSMNKTQQLLGAGSLTFNGLHRLILNAMQRERHRRKP